MFFYPDPEPIGYCITDVSPSYLTDGVFFNACNIGPTHKCVGKQLSAIPRGPNDPVAPRAEVNTRTLENWTIRSRAWYVDNCGRNAKALYGMMQLLPEEKIDAYSGWKSKVAVFPRSEQYEYWYLKKKRIKNAENLQITREELKRKIGEEGESNKVDLESSVRAATPAAAFPYTKTPIWWKDRIPNRVECAAVGNIDDYEFQCEFPHSQDYENHNLIIKKSSIEDYLAGVGCRKENSDKNEMCIMSLENEKRALKKDKSLVCGITNGKKRHDNNDDDDLKKGELDAEEVELDSRWQSWHEVNDVPSNDQDRKNAMLNLVQKSYRHEINTWYSKKKPTKLIPT